MIKRWLEKRRRQKEWNKQQKYWIEVKGPIVEKPGCVGFYDDVGIVQYVWCGP